MNKVNKGKPERAPSRQFLRKDKLRIVKKEKDLTFNEGFEKIDQT